MKNIIVKLNNDRDWSKIFMDESHYDELIDEDVFLRKENGDPLLVMVKKAISPELGGQAWSTLKKINLNTRNRGDASGITNQPHKKKDGTVSHTVQVPKGWDVMSGILGYFERTVRKPYCRACACNKNDPEMLAQMIPVLQHVSGIFKRLVPDRHAVQQSFCDKTHKDWVIPGTVYTTVTVNKTFRTAAHLDAGDLAEGFSNMFVIKQGAIKGGHLVLPNYRLAVKLDNLDFVMFDAHTFHGNTQILSGSKDAVRCSVVCYFRTKMTECRSAEEELKLVKNRRLGEKLFEA